MELVYSRVFHALFMTAETPKLNCEATRINSRKVLKKIFRFNRFNTNKIMRFLE